MFFIFSLFFYFLKLFNYGSVANWTAVIVRVCTFVSLLVLLAAAAVNHDLRPAMQRRMIHQADMLATLSINVSSEILTQAYRRLVCIIVWNIWSSGLMDLNVLLHRSYVRKFLVILVFSYAFSPLRRTIQEEVIPEIAPIISNILVYLLRILILYAISSWVWFTPHIWGSPLLAMYFVSSQSTVSRAIFLRQMTYKYLISLNISARTAICAFISIFIVECVVMTQDCVSAIVLGKSQTQTPEDIEREDTNCSLQRSTEHCCNKNFITLMSTPLIDNVAKYRNLRNETDNETDGSFNKTTLKRKKS